MKYQETPKYDQSVWKYLKTQKIKNKLLKLVKELRAIKITFSLHNHAFEYFPLNIF